MPNTRDVEGSLATLGTTYSSNVLSTAPTSAKLFQSSAESVTSNFFSNFELLTHLGEQL